MLFTDIKEKQTDFVYPNGYRHDDSLILFRKRLAKASLFVLDGQASAMAASVSFSKPSSVIACLPFIQNLPFETMWIEFSNQQLRTAMAAIGSTNATSPDKPMALERGGFLLQMSDGQIVMDYVYRHKTPTGTLADLCAVRGYFDVQRPSEAYKFPAMFSSALTAEPGPANIEEGITGKVRKRLKAVHSDLDERAARAELKMRFRTEPHADLADIRTAFMSAGASQSEVDRILTDHAEDMWRFFDIQILPALILLNCRNAVDREVVEAPAKLNKARAAKGKPPISEYHNVKIHLSPSKRRIYEAHGGSRSPSAGGLVIGHFKVRQTGIWWWSPHFRSGHGETPTRVNVLTR